MRERRMSVQTRRWLRINPLMHCSVLNSSREERSHTRSVQDIPRNRLRDRPAQFEIVEGTQENGKTRAF